MIFIIPNIQIDISSDTIEKIKHKFLSLIKEYISNIHSQQIEFAEGFISILFHPVPDYGKNRPTVIPCRCGIGKSQCIQALCMALYELDIRDIGIVIVTNALDRLETLSKGELEYYYGKRTYFQRSAYISSRNETPIKKQIISANYKQFVFLTSQRIKDMSEFELEELLSYRYNNTVIKRVFMLFDETPIAQEVIRIGRKEINDISTAIAEGVPTNEKNRNFVIVSYERLRETITNDFLLMDNKTQAKLGGSDKRDYFVKHFSIDSLTEDDNLFFAVIEKYKRSINHNKSLDSNSYELLHYLKEIISKGVIVQACKSTVNTIDQYELAMFYLKNNMFCLTQDIKTFVLDATAFYEPIYKHKTFMIAYGLNFKPLKLLELINIDVNVRRDNTDDKATGSEERNKNIAFLKALNTDMRSRIGDDHALIVCYKGRESYFENPPYAVEHFGNVRGSNEYYSFDNVVQFGLNRQSGFDYLMTFYFLYPRRYEELLSLDEQGSRDEIARRTSILFGVFSTRPLNDYCMNRAIADLEQNLFRCSLRDFNSTTKARLYLYCNSKYMDKIGDYFRSAWNAEIHYVKSDILTNFNKANRKPKKTKSNSVAGKVMNYINNIPDDTEFRTKDVLDNCRISNEQLKTAKKDNKSLNNVLNMCKVSKGKFIKRSKANE